MENLTPINGAYLLKENREGFDVVERGDLKLQIAARTGNNYTNFSNKCDIVVAPKGGKYKVGDTVWVHHFVSDQKYNDGLLYANENQFWFKGDKLSEIEDDNIVIFQPDLHDESTTASGLILISYDTKNSEKFGERGKVVSGGGLKKGSQIYYHKNRELEVWENEVMYLIIEKTEICMVDGECFGDWYISEPLNETDLYFKYKIRFPKKGVISLLKNPHLPLDGSFVVLANAVVPCFVSPDKILSTIDLPEAVSLSA